MAGLVPAISIRLARCIPKRDARDKPAHDEEKATLAHDPRKFGFLFSMKARRPSWTSALFLQRSIDAFMRAWSGSPEALTNSSIINLELAMDSGAFCES